MAHSSSEALPRTARSAHPALPAAALFVSLAAVSAPLMAVWLWGDDAAGAILVAFWGTGLGGALMLVGLARTYPHHRFGLCNGLTMTRATLVAVLAGGVAMPALAGEAAAVWKALAVAVTALALDGLDGWSARRTGLVSRFGARFDMEVDTALALVLSVLAVLDGKIGLWVLGLGLMRPAFVLASLAAPRLRQPLPPALWRKGLCVVQIGALILLLAPPISSLQASLIAAGALSLLVAGFARDTFWLLRQP